MKTCKLAIWSLVAGITGFVIPPLIGISYAYSYWGPGSPKRPPHMVGFSFLIIASAAISSILAIILGIIALKKIKAQPAILTGKTLAVIGITLGVVCVVLAAFFGLISSLVLG